MILWALLLLKILLEPTCKPASFSFYQPPCHHQDLPSTAIAVGVPPGHTKESGWEVDGEAGICYLRLLRKEVKTAMANIEFCGIVEQRPSVFDAYPHYSTFSLRTITGARVEVFLPTATVESDPARYCAGRHLTLTGGEQQLDPGVDGQADYIRYSPDRVWVEKEPEYLF